MLLIYGLTALLGTLALLTSGRAQIASFAAFAVALGVAVVALAQRGTSAPRVETRVYEKADPL